MKYIIKTIKDEKVVSETNAINAAKRELAHSGKFGAIYGNRINGKKVFFAPKLVTEEELKQAQKDLLSKDKEGLLFVIYQTNLEDAPFYYNEFNGGEASIDIPDEEIRGCFTVKHN